MGTFNEKLCKFVDLINPLTHLKNAWTEKTPKQKWATMQNLIKRSGYIIHIRIFDTRQNGPIAYIPLISGFAYYTSVVYTVYYYSNIGRFREGLTCFCMFGVLTSVS